MYCGNNPLIFIDPTGKVVTTTKEDLEKLKEILPEEAYKYLELNDGTLNVEKLAEAGLDDANYQALLELAQSKEIYNFSSGSELTEVSSNGSENTYHLSFPGWPGLTLEREVSKTGVNEIMISDQLTGEKMAEYIAHELGHGLLLDRSRINKNIYPWHIIKYDKKVGGKTDKNIVLKTLQKQLIMNAIRNYHLRHGGTK